MLIKTKQNRKCKIPHTILERQTLCLAHTGIANKKWQSKTNDLEVAKEKTEHFLSVLSKGKFFKFYLNLCFISMYSTLNTLSEHSYFYKSKNITSYTSAACSQNRRKSSIYP